MRLLLFCATFATSVGCISLKRPVGDWTEAFELPMEPAVMHGATVGVECVKSSTEAGLQPGDTQAAPATLSTATLEACRHIVRIVRNMGATVVAAPALETQKRAEKAKGKDKGKKEADEPIVAKQTSNDGAGVGKFVEGAFEAAEEGSGPEVADYKIRYVDRRSYRDWCGWTLLPFVLSFSFFPCVEDIDVGAEVQVLDSNDLVVERYPLTMHMRSIWGPASLYFRLVALATPERQKRQRKLLAQSLVTYVRNIVYTYRVRQHVDKALPRPENRQAAAAPFIFDLRQGLGERAPPPAALLAGRGGEE